MKRLAAAFPVWLSLAGISFAQEAKPLPEIDRSGKGAVLCLHNMIATAKTFAEKCLDGREIEVRRLTSALKRFEAFEIQHGGWSASQAAEFTQRAQKFSDDAQESVCGIQDKDASKFLTELVAEFGGIQS